MISERLVNSHGFTPRSCVTGRDEQFHSTDAVWGCVTDLSKGLIIQISSGLMLLEKQELNI